MFSVIIPLYNKRQFISRSIDSVLNQSFSDFEIIVVDDGSTDGGGEFVAAQYGEKVKLVIQDNQGVSAARNKGIQNAGFEYLAFLDADDMWHPNFLMWMSKIVQTHSDASVLGSTYTTELPFKLPYNPTIIEIKDYFRKADYNTLFTSSSTVIRKDFFQDNEGFKTHLTKGEDLDLWFRAIAWFGKCFYVNAPLMYYDLTASAGTKQLPDLNRTIFSELLNPALLPKETPFWQGFKEKFIRLNLWTYFEKKDNWLRRKEFLTQVESSYFLATILYSFPFPFWEMVHKSSSAKSLLRKYLKFCFRYIYR